MQIACPQCGESTTGGRFCDHCGTRLERICAGCGEANRLAARFCAGCGAGFEGGRAAPPSPETAVAQQKHVSILFADICGSTELISSMDPEDAGNALGAVMRAVAEAVVRCGGIVTTYMGDGLMALFGAPVAAEDHAARACFAALAILEDVRALGAPAPPVRIGICSGPVILRAIGRDAGDYAVAGIAAHIAARLEQQAEPGCVLLAQHTASLVHGIATLEPMGPLSLKGIAEPVPVYRLLGAASRPSWTVRSGGAALARFVGREEELAQLRGALERAAAGRVQAVALVGEPGIGKSRLLHEFVGGLAPGTWHVMRVETTAQSAAIPQLLVTALLREITGCAPTDGDADVAAKLAAAVDSLGPGTQLDIVPLLAHLDSAGGGTDYAGIEPAHRRQRLVQALRQILLRYADLHPLIIILEDYHWLDTSSVEVLHGLMEGLDSARLLLLVTTRPERRPGWGPAASQGGGPRGEIELRVLPPDPPAALLEELSGQPAPLAPLRAHITPRADAPPFSLGESPPPRREPGAWPAGAPRLPSIEIPGSVQAILASRIDRLSPHHRRILQVASVVGRDIPLPLLAAAAEMPQALLVREIADLRAAGFLTELRLPWGAVHHFAHALIQAVAYDSLLRSDRRGLHERVLRALEAQATGSEDVAIEDLAHHATRAESWPEAARYALEAGERAAHRSAWAEARAFFEAAIVALQRLPASADTASRGIDARLRLRFVLGAASDVAQVQEHLREADRLAEQTGDRVSLARVHISRATALSHGGDLTQAIALGRVALDTMLEAGDAVGIVGAAFALAQAQWYAGEFREGRHVLESTLAHARSEIGHSRTSATFVLPSVVFFCYLARICDDLGASTAGVAAIREARSLADRDGHAFDRLLVNIYEGALLLSGGQAAAAIETLEGALEAARSNELGYHIPSIASVLGRAYVDAGRHPEARDLLASASAYADRNGRIGKRLICTPPLIRALSEGAGRDLDAARTLAALTMREAETRGYRPVLVEARIAVARAFALAGEPDRAVAALREAAALARQLGLVRAEVEARELAAGLLDETGLPAQALREAGRLGAAAALVA